MKNEPNIETEDAGRTRPKRGGEVAATRFGMEDADDIDIPANGVVAEQQSPDKR